MKLFKKNESVKSVDCKPNGLGVKKFVALILLLIITLFIVSEIVTYTTWAMPQFASYLFQLPINIKLETTISECAIGDMAIMFVYWILPCLFVLGLSIYIHIKLLKWYFKKFVMWMRVIFST